MKYIYNLIIRTLKAIDECRKLYIHILWFPFIIKDPS